MAGKFQFLPLDKLQEEGNSSCKKENIKNTVFKLF